MDRAEVAIVGSGPLGAAAAKVLVGAGARVTMLEAGKRRSPDSKGRLERALTGEDVWKSRPWRYESIGDDLDLDTFAIRTLGGSSGAWGAVTPRYLESDFRMKSRWGIARDWPLTYEELEPYYLAAERLMGVSGQDERPFSPPRSAPYPMPAFPMSETDLYVKGACDRLGIPLISVPVARNSVAYQGRPRCTYYAVCRACPIDAKYDALRTVEELERQPRFKLLLGADVVRIEADREGNARRVIYVDEREVEHSLEADRIILAVQGVEAVRLLLDSGLATRNGVLGRGLMEHPKFYMVGRVPAALDAQRYDFETATTLLFHDHPRRGEHAGGRLMVRVPGAFSPSTLARESGLWGRELSEELRELFGHHLTLGAFLEQLPYEENRVTLSETMQNEHGRPAARVELTLMRAYETQGYLAMMRQMEQIFDALGATGVRVLMPPSIGGHYLGCHRMGDDPETSVTDSFLECHEVKRLFLATQGAFPTGGISNPTLTGVALSMRMAHHILGGRAQPA